LSKNVEYSHVCEPTPSTIFAQDMKGQIRKSYILAYFFSYSKCRFLLHKSDIYCHKI